MRDYQGTDSHRPIKSLRSHLHEHDTLFPRRRRYGDRLEIPSPTTGAKYSSRLRFVSGLQSATFENWAPFPVEPRSIESVILTDAHLDHSGYLPLLVKRGFKERVFCTRATGELCAILLSDAGHLQEKDAEYANRHKFSKHKPALPLYTEQDAWAALEHLTPVSFDEEQALPGAARLRFRQMGHILGAASVQID